MEVWPVFNDNMISSVVDVLKSGKVNQWTGNKVKTFEKQFSEYFNCKYSVAVFNGTVALELCLKALDIQEGDEVIVTSRTFLASASCCSYYNIVPVFADVDLNSQNITLDEIKKVKTNKTKAVILVHLAGWACEMDEIMDYCKQNNLYVIEDCAQCHGAKYKDKYLGTFGDINAWSFCQDKIMTTGGEGGMITTNNEELYKKAWSIKDHGKDYDLVFSENKPSGFHWLHKNVGTNWRMTEMQAVIGIEALKCLNEWVNIRRRNANILINKFKDIPYLRIPLPESHIYHSYYKFYVFVDTEERRNKILKKMNDSNIKCLIGSCGEVYKEKALEKYANQECKNAKQLFETSLCFLVDPTYTEDKINDYTNKCIKIFEMFM